MHAALYAAGWACLLIMLVIAIWSMFEVVAPQWRRILSLAAGNIKTTSEPLPSDTAARSEHFA